LGGDNAFIFIYGLAQVSTCADALCLQPDKD